MSQWITEVKIYLENRDLFSKEERKRIREKLQKKEHEALSVIDYLNNL